MVMAIKYQILMCRNPRHLVMITLNHIDAMMDFTTNTAVKQNIHTAYELLIQVTLTTLEMVLEPLSWSVDAKYKKNCHNSIAYIFMFHFDRPTVSCP